MNNQEEKDKKLEALRKQTEKNLHSWVDDEAQAMADPKFKRLLYELQVHQVELETQNEELRRSQMETEQSRKEYADLYNYAPVHYFTLDTEGHIIRHNLLAAQLIGYKPGHLNYKRLIIFVAPEDTQTYFSFFKKIKETRTKQVTQVTLVTKNGESRIVQLQGAPSLNSEDESGNVSQILLTATDLTEQKKAEGEIRFAERFRHIIEGIPGMYLFLAPDYAILEASNHYLQALYLERKQVIGYTISEIFSQNILHNSFSAALLQSLLQVSYNQNPHTIQVLRYDVTLPDGRQEERYWRVTHSPVLNQYNQVDYIIHQMVDVTREYLVQQEMESNRQRFEMLALATNDIVWEWNIITDQWWWNQNLETYFGYNRATLEPGVESWADCIHPEEKEQVVHELMNLLATGHSEWRKEYRFRRSNGSYAYVLDRAYALQDAEGKTVRMLGTLVDITEQKEAEQALRRINERFALLLDSIPHLAWISEPDGNTYFYNQKWFSYTGAHVNNLQGWEWQQYVHPEDAGQTLHVWEKALQTGQTALLQSRWRQASTGQYRWHIGQIIPVHSENGQITNWVGSLTDIHDQKQIEEALRDNAELREAQRKLKIERDFSRSLVDNSIDGIFTFDTAPCYTSWNPVLEGMYSITREEVVNKKIFEVFPDYQYTEEGHAILQVLKGNKITLYKQPYENKEGFYELNLIPLRNEQQEVIGGLGIVHDVTEQIKLEEERTSLKLKRQKELLNTILETQEGERRRIAEALHNGLAQTLYAAKLKLEQMPIEQANRKQFIDMKENASELLADAIQETRNISHELIPRILEDFGLKGAIIDFCKKYAHAHLAIKTEIYGLDERIDKYLEIAIYRITQELVNNVIKHAQATKLQLHVVKGELGILIKVSDNGKGFQVETMQNSAKGIGLKTIQDRVKLLNGTMEIESQPGKGTTVTIKIPAS